jgi:2-polyprenyl-3-methyl-5-hydroxy-6-metoxy-1,4-benzoquinol methylase
MQILPFLISQSIFTTARWDDVMLQFDFGKNWADYSAHAINAERVTQAREDFAALHAEMGGVAGKSFLDVGFGQGLSLLSAALLGARVFGVDINPKCEEVLRRNQRFFPRLEELRVPVAIGSILDKTTVDRARAASPNGEGFDIVHSWGVLHHTGNMALAVKNAAGLVRPGGHFVVALYNRHWSSRPWLLVKYVYCKSPPIVQTALVWALTPVIYIAKRLVTRDEPHKQSRGMDFFYNVVDWVGGYPYEYASKTEAFALIEPLGFDCIKFVPSQVPTGCNEFVFQRN